jgi:hypothetical protein
VVRRFVGDVAAEAPVDGRQKRQIVARGNEAPRTVCGVSRSSRHIAPGRKSCSRPARRRALRAKEAHGGTRNSTRISDSFSADE